MSQPDFDCNVEEAKVAEQDVLVFPLPSGAMDSRP